MNPTWFTDDPTEPPDPGAFPRARLIRTPGKITASAFVTGVPPMATKIFLLAWTSREAMCQCPIVTPASLKGNGCATAVPVASVEANHKPAITALMDGSLNKAQNPRLKIQLVQ